MMKALQTFLVLTFCAVALEATAQVTGISIETVMVHDGSIDASLEGYTTYRIYADVSSEFDFVSSVFGDATSPLMLGCDGTIYQSATSTNPAVDYNYGNAVNAAFFPVFPTTQYDSWLTIGADNSNQGVNVQSTDATMAPALALFNAGEGFVINDPFGATWFNVYPCAGAPDLAACAGTNPAFGGSDNKVLLAQITANGDVYGLFNVQVYPNGVQSAQVLSFGLTFSTDESDVFGCTNEVATNYDPTATVDDFTCTLPCAVSLQVDNVQGPTCNGDNDGLIQVSATGAQGADYYYFESLDATAQNFGNFPNLTPGWYTIYVLDGAGCESSMEVEVPETAEVHVEAQLTTPISCNGEEDATITISEATGGNGEFQFWLSSNPTQISSQTEWAGLAPGLHTVYASDSNGCIGISPTILISSPQAIGVYVTYVQDASCADVPDGEIGVGAFGGTGPSLSFSIDGSQYGPSPLMVPSGTYTVTAQDMNGCIGVYSENVQVGPAPVVLEVTATPENCHGQSDGEISWTASGGVGGLVTLLNGNVIEGSLVTDLPPGVYELETLDANGCQATTLVDVEEAAPIEVAANVLDVSCYGASDGAAQVFASGGAGGFQYSDDGVTFQSNAIFTELNSGPHLFVVQDQNGCLQSFDTTIYEPTALELGGAVAQGQLDGQGWIDATATGGTPPYEFVWNGPGVDGWTTEDLNGISSGTYILQAFDANGCSASQSFELVTSSLGCIDMGACNYEPNASVDDGSCDYSCYGCLDSAAFNFDPEATVEDGSCIFFDPSCESIGEPPWDAFAAGLYPESTVQREFGLPTSWTWALHMSSTVVEPNTGQTFAVQSFAPQWVVGLPNGMAIEDLPWTLGPNQQACLVVSGTPVVEGFFDVTVGGTLTISLFGNAFELGNFNVSASVQITPNVNGIPGCQYAFASNFNALATVDDGSCELAGCTEMAACNFNSFATTDDGSCDFACLGCTYEGAVNYTANATLDDGTCLFELSVGCALDTDNDGLVGTTDLLELLAYFGMTCE